MAINEGGFHPCEGGFHPFVEGYEEAFSIQLVNTWNERKVTIDGIPFEINEDVIY